MRLAVLLLGALELLLLVVGLARAFLGGARSDAAGEGMSQAYVIIGTILALLLLLPALGLAWNGRLLWLDLVLALLAGVGVLMVLVSR